MAVIGVKYKEGKHKSWKAFKYAGVYIHYSDNKKLFNSGNFIKDWFDAKMFYLDELQDKEPYLSQSSSCDHFIMDNAPFDSGYLHVIDEKPILKYLDRTDPKWYLSKDGDGWEFFVPEGTTPTWQELKEMSK